MKNAYDIIGDSTVIFMKTKRGLDYKTTIDTIMLAKADSFSGTWYANIMGDLVYVAGRFRIEGKHKTVPLHRFITDAPAGYVVDHIDHDTLNNRFSNLRLLNQSENGQHRKGAQRNSKTGIRGVSWSKVVNQWVVQISVRGKNICVGYFHDIGEAEQAAIKARKKYKFKSEVV